MGESLEGMIIVIETPVSVVPQSSPCPINSILIAPQLLINRKIMICE
jgi:hypothetical protein